MLTIEIKVQNIESVRQILQNNDFINHDYRIKIENGYGYIPIKEEIGEYKIDEMIKRIKEDLKDIGKFSIKKVNMDVENFESIKIYPRNTNDLLKDKLTEEEIEKINKSYDVIGDIVIVEIPEELQIHKKDIGEATLRFTKRRSVYMKKSAVEGVTRTRKLELLAGADNPITIHKEHGTRLKLDVKNVYFSPRLATERLRVAELVENGEEILDMFAGIGPFPIVIGTKKSADITAVDINKVAIKYLNENIKLNKLAPDTKIKTICGDTSKVCENELKNKKFDRIIMNLPGLAPKFLPLAIQHAKNNGVIHYYEFSDGFSQGIKRVQNAAEKENKEVNILNTRKVKSTSPGMWHVAIDCEIKDKD